MIRELAKFIHSCSVTFHEELQLYKEHLEEVKGMVFQHLVKLARKRKNSADQLLLEENTELKEKLEDLR